MQKYKKIHKFAIFLSKNFHISLIYSTFARFFGFKKVRITKQTMTKAELVSEIAITTGYDKKTVSTIVEKFTEGIKNNMGRGKEVYIRGFGSFITKDRKERIARNITARTSVYVPAHSVPVFKPAQEFKDCVHNLKNKKVKK